MVSKVSPWIVLLRHKILKAGRVHMAPVTFPQKTPGDNLPKNLEIVEIGIDDLMSLVTAEVEKARIDEIDQAIKAYKAQMLDDDGVLEAVIRDLERRKRRLQPQKHPHG